LGKDLWVGYNGQYRFPQRDIEWVREEIHIKYIRSNRNFHMLARMVGMKEIESRRLRSIFMARARKWYIRKLNQIDRRLCVKLHNQRLLKIKNNKNPSWHYFGRQCGPPKIKKQQ